MDVADTVHEHERSLHLFPNFVQETRKGLSSFITYFNIQTSYFRLLTTAAADYCKIFIHTE